MSAQRTIAKLRAEKGDWIVTALEQHDTILAIQAYADAQRARAILAEEREKRLEQQFDQAIRIARLPVWVWQS